MSNDGYQPTCDLCGRYLEDEGTAFKICDCYYKKTRAIATLREETDLEERLRDAENFIKFIYHELKDCGTPPEVIIEDIERRINK